MEVQEEQLEDENGSEEERNSLSIQQDPRLSTLNGNTLPPIMRGFNLSSLDNAGGSFNRQL